MRSVKVCGTTGDFCSAHKLLTVGGEATVQRSVARGKKIPGFTVIELMVSITIVAVLATIAMKAYEPLMMKSESVRCSSNMRSLHISLSSYINDVGHWPQAPTDTESENVNEEFEDWWIAEMKPYDVPELLWKCPTVYRLVQHKNPETRPKLHYTPSSFDSIPLSPYRWATQPWLMEIGPHGNILFMDGSVRNVTDFIH